MGRCCSARPWSTPETTAMRASTTLPIAVPDGQYVSATATDPAGNTSEFSPYFQSLAGGPSGPSADLSVTGTATPGPLMLGDPTDLQFDGTQRRSRPGRRRHAHGYTPFRRDVRLGRSGAGRARWFQPELHLRHHRQRSLEDGDDRRDHGAVRSSPTPRRLFPRTVRQTRSRRQHRHPGDDRRPLPR